MTDPQIPADATDCDELTPEDEAILDQIWDSMPGSGSV